MATTWQVWEEGQGTRGKRSPIFINVLFRARRHSENFDEQEAQLVIFLSVVTRFWVGSVWGSARKWRSSVSPSLLLWVSPVFVLISDPNLPAEQIPRNLQHIRNLSTRPKLTSRSGRPSPPPFSPASRRPLTAAIRRIDAACPSRWTSWSNSPALDG